jgi:phosphoserine phosphatase RsbU/P
VRHRLQCAQVWGGVRDEDVDACSAALDVSLISIACGGGGRGGDVYYFTVCEADLLTRVVLADVVGHGSAVSEVGEWLFDAMRRQMNTLDGDRILAELNAITVQRGLSAMSTAAVAAFYRADARLYFAYAGHHPALVLRRADTSWQTAMLDRAQDTSNLPLGVLAEASYEQGQLPLNPGDRLVMYTDGLIEAPNAAGELFGLERLLDVLNRHVAAELGEIKRAVISAVRHHTGGSLCHDDVTLLVAEAR